MQTLHIVKIGGNVIDDQERQNSFLKTFHSIKGMKILVHGGGKSATEISRKLGIEPKLVNGRRITDEETLKVVMMVYAGLVNKEICAFLQSLGTNAIGLTGADANIIPATKRAVKEIDYGFVGDINIANLNPDILSKFLEMGLVPVIAPLTHDGKGNMLNTNSDTIASTIAVLMAKIYNVSLIYAFEQKGVLESGEVISQITNKTYTDLLKDGIIKDGMIPKLTNSFEALNHGVKSVIICNYDDVAGITNDNIHVGTRVTL